ncbi:MAG: energy transducer TonB [Gemmatimonadota bacterium]
MRLRSEPVGWRRRDTGREGADPIPGRSRAGVGVLILGATLLLPACRGDDATRLPRPMSDNPPIDYPIDLWDAGIEGETLLTLHVDAEGRVDSAFVDRSSGSPKLDSAAARGGRAMRFTPARRGDRRVATWVRIPVRFMRDSVATATSRPPRSEGNGFHE